MKNLIFIILSMIFGFGGCFAQTSPTPDQILNRSIQKIAGSKSAEADFTVTNSGYTGRGKILTMGSKFQVIMPDASVWFNGTDLYTYNQNTSETTIVTPTADELEESNPLSYVVNAPKNYNVSFSTVKKTGKYVLELLPKKKNGGIKRITLTLSQKEYYPEKIVVEPSKGNPIVAEIHSFKTGVAAKQSDFEYPKSKYPKAEIIDLR